MVDHGVRIRGDCRQVGRAPVAAGQDAGGGGVGVVLDLGEQTLGVGVAGCHARLGGKVLGQSVTFRCELQIGFQRMVSSK